VRQPCNPGYARSATLRIEPQCPFHSVRSAPHIASSPYAPAANRFLRCTLGVSDFRPTFAQAEPRALRRSSPASPPTPPGKPSWKPSKWRPSNDRGRNSWPRGRVRLTDLCLLTHRAVPPSASFRANPDSLGKPIRCAKSEMVPFRILLSHSPLLRQSGDPNLRRKQSVALQLWKFAFSALIVAKN
jgi:hypothetical protein